MGVLSIAVLVLCAAPVALPHEPPHGRICSAVLEKTFMGFVKKGGLKGGGGGGGCSGELGGFGSPPDFMAVAQEMMLQAQKDDTDVQDALNRLMDVKVREQMGDKEGIKVLGMGGRLKGFTVNLPPKGVEVLTGEGSALHGLKKDLKTAEDVAREAQELSSKIRESTNDFVQDWANDLGVNGTAIEGRETEELVKEIVQREQQNMDDIKAACSGMEYVPDGNNRDEFENLGPPHPDQVALWRACDDGDPAAIHRLAVSAHVDLDSPDPNHWAGLRAIHMAARGGSVATVRALAAEGVKMEGTDKYLETSLHMAAREGCTDVASLLLKLPSGKGAILVDAKNYLGQTPLMVALEGGHPLLLNVMPAQVLPEPCISSGAHSLIPALDEPHIPGARGDFAGTVRTLLDAGASTGARDEVGWTPLHYAARWGPTSGILQMLMQYGADVNCVSASGHTPLDWAVEEGGEDAVKVLEGAGGRRGVGNGESVWDKYCRDVTGLGGEGEANQFKQWMDGELEDFQDGLKVEMERGVETYKWAERLGLVGSMPQPPHEH